MRHPSQEIYEVYSIMLQLRLCHIFSHSYLNIYIYLYINTDNRYMVICGVI